MQDVCYTIEGLMTREECEALIERGQNGLYRDMSADYPSSYRNNDRLTVLDPGLAQSLMQRLESTLPKRLRMGGQDWHLDSLNPKFRGCRYSHGQSFTRHRDGAYSPEDGKQSLLTVMLYLNDGSTFQGGRTRFYQDRFVDQPDFSIQAQTGRAIIFSHQYWHDGEAVLEGTKHVLRTDVIYRASHPTCLGHRGYVWDIIALPDGTLVTGSRDTTIRLWNEGKSVALPAHESSVTCLGTTEKGFLSGGRDRQIILWEKSAQSAVKVAHWTGHDGALLQVASRTDGTLLSCGADGWVRHWRGPGVLIDEWSVDSWPWSLHQQSDGGLLVGTEEGHLYRLTTGQKELLSNFSCPIQSLAQATDGVLYLGCGDGNLRLLSPGFELLDCRPGHRGPITSVVLLDGETPITGAEDDGVRVWRGPQSDVLTQHQDFVRALCLTHDGRVASVSYDGRVLVSEVNSLIRA